MSQARHHRWPRLRSLLVGAAALAIAVPLLATPSVATGVPAVGLGSVDEPPGTATASFLTGWFPYWYGDSEVSRILAHRDLTSEVMPFWLYSRYSAKSSTYPDGIVGPVCVHDGSDKRLVECARTQPTPSQQAQVARLQAAGIAVMPAFTDDSAAGVLAGVLKSTTKRRAHVAAQVSFVVRNGFDGLDLDYEGFAYRDSRSGWAATRPAWILYVKELAAALHAKGKRLSVTVPAGEPVRTRSGAAIDSTGYGVYAWSEIAASIDRLRIMTYDYSWDAAGPIGPASWVDRVASSAVEQVGAANARKVWLGIAAYGYDWRTSTTCGSPQRSRKYTRSPAEAWSTYNAAKAAGRLVKLAGQSVAAYAWDSAAAEYTYKYKQSDIDAGTGKACTNVRTVWFQDGRSHVVRARIAATYRMGGVAMWAFGDESAGTWSQLTAAAPGIAPMKPAVSVTASAAVLAGNSAVVTATVRAPSGSGLARVPLALQWRPRAGGAWRTVLSATSSTTGTVRFVPTPTRNGSWQVVAAPAYGRQPAVSRVATTLVQPRVSLHLTSARVRTAVATVPLRALAGGVTAMVRASSRARLGGRVVPMASGQLVSLYRVGVGGRLSWLATVPTTPRGGYAFTLPTRTRGTFSYRVYSRSSVDFAPGSTPVLTLSVR